MKITVEAFHKQSWVAVGTWEPRKEDENRGFAGRGVWRYDMDFVLENIHKPLEGPSLGLPVVFDSIALGHWPAFLLDLLPAGPARKEWLDLLRLPNGPAADLPLLQHAGRAPVGNLRIRHPSRIGLAQGFPRSEILSRHQRFLVYMRESMVNQLGAPGDTPYSALDSQGAAPKYLLTEDTHGMWWAEGTLADENCAKFWLVKFPRGRHSSDTLILRSEALYAEIARAWGGHVAHALLWEQDILFVPRFDRERLADGSILRHGLETLCSAMGIAEFGHTFRHEELCACIAKYSSNPAADLLEYLRRDILNLALANSDNHARNTSFLKQNANVRLSPLYDFAPMELDPEGISRQVRWQGETLYTLPWNPIAELLSPWVSQDALRAFLCEISFHLERLPQTMSDLQVPAPLIEYCQDRWPQMLKSIREYLT